jgi:hypothetical protein
VALPSLVAKRQQNKQIRVLRTEEESADGARQPGT